MSIRGSIDHIARDGATGWVFAPEARDALTVQALLDGRIIGEGTAEQERPDLAAAGFGDGRCGFEIRFYDEIEPTLLPFVSVRPRGSDVELPRHSPTGFGEFFRALYARHPGAGRHRSVFGGLWTDRTDALRMLAGRVGTGATPADMQGMLRPLINEGYVVLRSALAPTGFAAPELALIESLEANLPLDPRAEQAARRLLEALPGVIFRETPLKVMRAAMEDNPLAYRAMLCRGEEGSFSQPSTAEGLPSPAECLGIVACTGEEGITLDVIRNSHTLPEFTADGRSRWLAAGAAVGVELAVQHGLSVDMIPVGPHDLVILSPGLLHRVRAGGEATGLQVWCAPARVSPLRFLTGQAGTFTVRHFSGAALVI